MKIRILCLILCLNLTSSLAQKPLFNSVELSKNYVINEILQDNFGFIWLATSEGPILYNGFEEIPVLPSPEECHTLYLSNNYIFSGHDNGKVYAIDVSSRQVIDSLFLNIESRISDITVIGESTIITSYGSGLFTTKDFKSFDALKTKIASNFIYEVEGLDDARIAIASDRGLEIIDINTQQVEQINNIPDVIITNLAFETDNKLWATTYKGHVFMVDLTTKSIQKFSIGPDHKIKDLYLKENRKYIVTTHELYELDEDNQLQQLLTSKGSKQDFSSVFVDHENNLWVTSTNNPIWKASLYFQRLELEGIKEIQALEKKGNKLFIGTSTGLFVFEFKARTVRKILDQNITCLTKFRDTIIVGTYTSGLFFLNDNTQITKRIGKGNGLSDNSILNIAIDQNDNLFISSLSGVFQTPLDPNHDQYLMVRPLSYDLGYSYVVDIHASHQNLYLFGMDKAGLVCIENGKVDKIKTLSDESLKLGSIYSIADAVDGTHWVSSENIGLLSYENGQLRKIESIKDHEEAYTSIIPLVNDNLLLVRASGIDLFDVKREHIMYFDEEAMIRTEEPYANNYALDGSEVWFVHHDKLYKFNTPSHDQKIHPTTSIDKIEVNLEHIVSDKVVFPQEENNFKFNYTGGWLTDPSKLSYSYYLDGYDQEWRETKDRYVNYPHLPPGSYTFNVKAAENEYFSDEPISSYSFRIKRAFYNSWWFYAIILTLLSYLFYYLFKRDQREKALKVDLEQKQIETQLINLKSQLNPHFLFNSFNTLSGLVEENPEKGISYIENITDFYRSILDIGDQKLIPLSKELELVELYKKLIAERFGEGFRLDFYISDNSVMIPPLTIQMLIENAVKHNQLSRNQPLLVTLKQTDNQLIIKNNIIPKNVKVHSTGLGIKNIKDRYRLLGFDRVVIENGQQDYTVILPTKRKQS